MTGSTIEQGIEGLHHNDFHWPGLGWRLIVGSERATRSLSMVSALSGGDFVAARILVGVLM
jgi:hypothetical protein